MGNNGIAATDLIPRLRDEFGYPPTGADLVAGKLVASKPVIKAAFLSWWQTGVLDEKLEVEGYTLKRLREEHGMRPIAAFLTLDWLLREPQAAQKSLARGHDRIKSNQ